MEILVKSRKLSKIIKMYKDNSILIIFPSDDFLQFRATFDIFNLCWPTGEVTEPDNAIKNDKCQVGAAKSTGYNGLVNMFKIKLESL